MNNFLIAERDGLHSRGACHIDGVRGNFHWHARAYSNLPGGIRSVSGLARVAEDHFMDFLRRDPGAVESSARGLHPQIGRSEIAQCATELSDGSPHRTQNINAFHYE